MAWLLWFVLSAVLIGVTIWSLQILLQQKRAWKAFATKHKFNYKPGTFMGPAEMDGVIGEYRVALFTAEREGSDVRTRRYVTVIEIALSEGLVDGGVVGTQQVLAFMQSLSKLHPYKIDHPGWTKEMHAYVHNDAAIAAYLTPDRLDTFAKILSTKNADVAVIFNDREILARFETIDPVTDAEKIDKAVTRAIGLLDKLRITKEQRSAYQALIQNLSSPSPELAAEPVNAQVPPADKS